MPEVIDISTSLGTTADLEDCQKLSQRLQKNSKELQQVQNLQANEMRR